MKTVRTMKTMWRPVALVAAAVMVLGFAACGSSSEGVSIIPKPAAAQGYDYDKNKDVKLDDDSSVPFNWAGWDIKKIELGKHIEPYYDGGGGTRTVYVTLTNRSKRDVTATKFSEWSDDMRPGGTLWLTGIKDGKESESYIELPLCVPVSTESDSTRGPAVDSGKGETFKAGETRTCLGEMFLTNRDGSPNADSFRPWRLDFEEESCDANNDRFDSCHSHLGTKQDIKVSR